jgi:hypothetical protein
MGESELPGIEAAVSSILQAAQITQNKKIQNMRRKGDWLPEAETLAVLWLGENGREGIRCILLWGGLLHHAHRLEFARDPIDEYKRGARGLGEFLERLGTATVRRQGLVEVEIQADPAGHGPRGLHRQRIRIYSTCAPSTIVVLTSATAIHCMASNGVSRLAMSSRALAIRFWRASGSDRTSRARSAPMASTSRSMLGRSPTVEWSAGLAMAEWERLRLHRSNTRQGVESRQEYSAFDE